MPVLVLGAPVVEPSILHVVADTESVLIVISAVDRVRTITIDRHKLASDFVRKSTGVSVGHGVLGLKPFYYRPA